MMDVSPRRTRKVKFGPGMMESFQHQLPLILLDELSDIGDLSDQSSSRNVHRFSRKMYKMILHLYSNISC